MKIFPMLCCFSQKKQHRLQCTVSKTPKIPESVSVSFFGPLSNLERNNFERNNLEK